MGEVTHPVGTRVRIMEHRDKFQGEEGTVVEHGEWTAPIRYRTLVSLKFEKRWYDPSDLEAIDGEAE